MAAMLTHAMSTTIASMIALIARFNVSPRDISSTQSSDAGWNSLQPWTMSAIVIIQSTPFRSNVPTPIGRAFTCPKQLHFGLRPHQLKSNSAAKEQKQLTGGNCAPPIGSRRNEKHGDGKLDQRQEHAGDTGQLAWYAKA